MENQEDRHLLKLVGITYNQIESGVYAVILQEANGTRRIPIIIGYPEAQAIECKLQEIVTPRPLTHDLIVNMMAAYGISLREIYIHKLPTGVFAAEMTLSRDGDRRVVDARSSDAIALAIRVGAPIYTSGRVLDEMGFEPGRNPVIRRATRTASQSKTPKTVSVQADVSSRSTDSLRKDMERAAENEDYELAARLKAELDRRERTAEGAPDIDPDIDIDIV